VSTFNMEWFPKKVMPKPNGYYAHIILLRVTESYALFQTDGELNTVRIGDSITSRFGPGELGAAEIWW
jgi:CRISPR-associated protein Csc2